MNTKIKALLEQHQVDGFFAYKRIHGVWYPYLFNESNLDQLEPWQPFKARYPIAKLLLAQARLNPNHTYGILVRGCEERAIHELYKWNQLNRERVVVVGQACSQELAQYCECWKPFPDQLDYGTAPSAGDSHRVSELEAKASDKRMQWWLSHFNRCIRCYGCRDVCPVCFCHTCSLEQNDVAPTGKLPPDSSFHLVRAIHMAGRCIDCGLCEEVCPSGIPLRALYKKVNNLVSEIFDYQTGSDDGKSPFSLLGEESWLPSGPR
jgi:formate dehydrogenase subunit beta